MSEETNIVKIIERAALNPEVDIDKLERLMQMQERILDRNAEQAFSADMVAAQGEMPTIATTARNQQTNSNYAKLDAIIQQASPIWTKHGFSLSFGEGDAKTEGYIRVECDVRHKQGHCVSYYRDLPLDDKGIKGSVNKTVTHASGSTVSYARRYLTCMIFNIATGDDADGNQPDSGYKRINADQLSGINKQLDNHGVGEGFDAWLAEHGVDGRMNIPASKFGNAIKKINALSKAKNGNS